jgi:hypothetical protein
MDIKKLMKEHGLKDLGLVRLLREFKRSKVSVWPDWEVKEVTTTRETVNRWRHGKSFPSGTNRRALEEIFKQEGRHHVA